MIKSNLRITFFLWYIKLRLKVECDNLNVKVMNMKKMELRHTKILELLTEKNKVDVTELSQNLGVSQVTIRKDLDMLEKKGLIVREHGFATLNGQDDMNNKLPVRTGLSTSQHRIVSRYGSQLTRPKEELSILAS